MNKMHIFATIIGQQYTCRTFPVITIQPEVAELKLL